MKVQKQTWLALAGAVLLATGVATAQTAPGSTSAPAGARPRLVPALRGEAELALTNPAVVRDRNNFVVTTLKVKNLSKAPIAGLKMEEFWYDKAGNVVGGDTFLHRRPLQPDEVLEITLRTPVNPAMDRPQYKFSHSNGTVKPTRVAKL